jgi:hypothetical protein
MNAAISRFGWVSKTDGVVTNLLMDGHRGGKLTVPASEYAAFLDAHASDVARGVPTFVVEYPTEPSRPYVDMDIETESGGTVCVHTVLCIVQRAFRATLGEDARLTLLAMVAPPKVLPSGRTKLGLHIVAPHARASRAELLHARSLAIPELGVVPIVNEWDDAYDKAVYMSSGLRLVGANKFENCKCVAGCGVCGGRRRFDAGRPYVIESVLASNGRDDPCMLAHLKLNIALLVKLGSIRCHERLNLVAAPDMARIVVKRKRGNDGGRIGSVGRELSRVVVVLSPEFGACEVRDVRELRNGDRVLALSCMRYCLNIAAEHGSSSIYFYLFRDGWITQRCHCPKYGCLQFRSRWVYASQELLRMCGLLSPVGLPLVYSL